MAKTLITYNGETKSIVEWANEYNAHRVNFARWQRDYGMAGAIKLSQMDDAERRLWRRQQRSAPGLSAGWFNETPDFDPDQEWRNRLSAWLRKGMTTEEIKIKIRMI